MIMIMQYKKNQYSSCAHQCEFEGFCLSCSGVLIQSELNSILMPANDTDAASTSVRKMCKGSVIVIY